MRIRLLEIEITRGMSIDEVGTGMRFMLPGEQACANISMATRGYYDGSERVIEADLAGGYELAENMARCGAIYDATGRFITEDPATAIRMGILKLAEEE